MLASPLGLRTEHDISTAASCEDHTAGQARRQRDDRSVSQTRLLIIPGSSSRVPDYAVDRVRGLPVLVPLPYGPHAN